jgi:hypothetical protein
MLVIDPPSGWKYGFPKPYDNPNKIEANLWLALNGYPLDEVRYWVEARGGVPCRFWEHRDATDV